MIPARRHGMALTLAVSLSLAVVRPAPAQEPEYVGRTPPRLSLLEGQVSFWRPGAENWEEAQINLPLAPGDYLATGPSSRAEVQIGARAFLRAAADTELGIEEQNDQLIRVEVSEGRVALDVRHLPSGTRIELHTPEGTLQVADEGFYDATVGGGRVAFSARNGGRGTVFGADESIDLRAGTEVVAGAAVGGLARYELAAPDEWERWNRERTDRLLASSGRGQVSDDVYGLDELDTYGTWREEPEYGRVWAPTAVPPAWAPYTTGRWLWDIDYGWSWVDTAPWGWAPYHYGRWVWCHSYWGWAPGPILARPVYYPALVGFVSGPAFGIAIGAPGISWVALGWGEPVVPWWGPSWYRGRPCWRGWGGPRYINNVYVDPHHPHGHGIRRYRNQEAPNAVVGVRRREFAGRVPQRFHFTNADQRGLQPVDSVMPVEPSEVGIQPTANRARPPRSDHDPRSPRGAGAASLKSRRMPGVSPENQPLPEDNAPAGRPPSRRDGVMPTDEPGGRTRPAPPHRSAIDPRAARSRPQPAGDSPAGPPSAAIEDSGGRPSREEVPNRPQRPQRPPVPGRAAPADAGDLRSGPSDTSSPSVPHRVYPQPRPRPDDATRPERERPARVPAPEAYAPAPSRHSDPREIRRPERAAPPQRVHEPSRQIEPHGAPSGPPTGGGTDISPPSSSSRASERSGGEGSGRSQGYGSPHMRSAPAGGPVRAPGAPQ